jgi:hypothetical protein
MTNDTNRFQLNGLFLPILEIRPVSAGQMANFISKNPELTIFDDDGFYTNDKL